MDYLRKFTPTEGCKVADQHANADGDGGELSPIETLRRLFGADVATTFQRAYGGTDIYIPLDPSADHEISKAIGHDRALALGSECGSVRFYIPKPRPRRHEQVAELAAKGIKNREIARQLGLAEGYVYAIRRQIKQRAQSAARPLTEKAL